MTIAYINRSVIRNKSLDKSSGKADWVAAIKNDGLAWTQVSDLNFWSNQVAVLYAVQSIPTYSGRIYLFPELTLVFISLDRRHKCTSSWLNYSLA